jgi:hypothetical protein
VGALPLEEAEEEEVKEEAEEELLGCELPGCDEGALDGAFLGPGVGAFESSGESPGELSVEVARTLVTGLTVRSVGKTAIRSMYLVAAANLEPVVEPMMKSSVTASIAVLRLLLRVWKAEIMDSLIPGTYHTFLRL